MEEQCKGSELAYHTVDCVANEACEDAMITITATNGTLTCRAEEEACRDATVTCADSCLLICDGHEACRDVKLNCLSGTCYWDCHDLEHCQDMEYQSGTWLSTSKEIICVVSTSKSSYIGGGASSKNL